MKKSMFNKALSKDDYIKYSNLHREGKLPTLESLEPRKKFGEKYKDLLSGEVVSEVTYQHQKRGIREFYNRLEIKGYAEQNKRAKTTNDDPELTKVDAIVESKSGLVHIYAMPPSSNSSTTSQTMFSSPTSREPSNESSTQASMPTKEDVKSRMSISNFINSSASTSESSKTETTKRKHP